MAPSPLLKEFFLQRTKITTTIAIMIVTTAKTPNTAPTAAPAGDPAPLIVPVPVLAVLLSPVYTHQVNSQ